MNEVIEFQFNGNNVRTITDEAGEIWFVGNEVCGILGYANARDAIKKLCRQKGVANSYPLQTAGGVQYPTCINEGNLYRLIIKSTKPESEPFEAWVCDEVLPTIRKTGSYAMPGAAARINELTAGISERLDRLEASMANMHLSFGSYSTVSGFVHACCKIGAYGLCVEKDVIYGAYVDFTRATGQKPEGRSNFCSKIYAGVVGAWASTLTKSGKRVPAIRGIDLLEEYAVIIDDFGARHLREMEAELEKRRRLYFGDIIPRGYLK